MTAHEAGPELDRLIAEKVMGWTVYQIPGMSIQPRGEPEMRPAIEYRKDGSLTYSEADDESLFWSPSTDITHAWEVVERMIALGKALSMATHGHDNEEWSVTFGRSNALAHTAELAICRAALLEVGT